jgi:hypothetical protein
MYKLLIKKRTYLGSKGLLISELFRVALFLFPPPVLEVLLFFMFVPPALLSVFYSYNAAFSLIVYLPSPSGFISILITFVSKIQ